MDQIIIKMISDYKMAIENSEKYIKYLNHLLTTENGSLIVIELIQNGALYIFQNLEILKYVIRPYDPINEHYDEFLANSPIPIEEMIKPEDFNPAGNRVELELIEEMGRKEELNTQMIEYLKSLSEDFVFEIDIDQKILLTLTTYETTKIFTLHLYYRIMEFLNHMQLG
jgi:hypothetical protein